MPTLLFIDIIASTQGQAKAKKTNKWRFYLLAKGCTTIFTIYAEPTFDLDLIIRRNGEKRFAGTAVSTYCVRTPHVALILLPPF